jgi:transposase-like protein
VIKYNDMARRNGPYSIQCKYCGKIGMIKNGKNNQGKQRYKCIHCGKQQILNSKFVKYSYIPELCEKIFQTYCTIGFDNTCRLYKISKATLANIVKKYKNKVIKKKKKLSKK